MGLTPSDLLTVTLVVTFAVAIGVAVYSRLLTWHRSRSPRLRLLTGTRSQHAAIVLAVRPVVRELIPGLEAAGLEVSSIALLPTLAGSAGEPLQAQVEQVNGTRSFIIRLAASRHDFCWRCGVLFLRSLLYASRSPVVAIVTNPRT